MNRRVRRGLEADDEPVAIATQPVRGIRRPLVRPHQFDFVVEGALLGDGEHRKPLAIVQSLFSRSLHNERLRRGVRIDDEPERLCLDNDRRLAVELGRQHLDFGGGIRTVCGIHRHGDKHHCKEEVSPFFGNLLHAEHYITSANGTVELYIKVF